MTVQTRLMINVQLHKLKVALEVMLQLAPPDHTLPPWLLAVGGIHAQPLEKCWFVGQLVSVATDLDIRCWEDMRSGDGNMGRLIL